MARDNARKSSPAAKSRAGEQRRARAAGHLRSQRSKDNEPARKKTLRDYGKQFGIMWGVLLLLQVVIIVIYRTARGFALEGYAEMWPSGFEANFLIFLPLVLGLGAIGLALMSPGNVRGVLLMLLALAPWAYAFNLESPAFDKVYAGVPTTLYSVSLGEELPEFERLVDDRGNPSLDYRTIGMVQAAMRTEIKPTVVQILPMILIWLLCLAPSFAAMTCRRYLPGRLGPRLLNLVALAAIGLFYGLALPLLTPGVQEVEAAFKVWWEHWPSAVLVVLPAVAGLLHLLDLVMPLKLVNAITRLSMKGALVLLVLYWAAFASADGLREFWQDEFRRGEVGERVVVVDGVERTEQVREDPGQRFARLSLHAILLWILLLGNLGLLVTGLVDLAALKLVRPEEALVGANRRRRGKGKPNQTGSARLGDEPDEGVPATDPGLSNTDALGAADPEPPPATVAGASAAADDDAGAAPEADADAAADQDDASPEEPRA